MELKLKTKEVENVLISLVHRWSSLVSICLVNWFNNLNLSHLPSKNPNPIQSNHMRNAVHYLIDTIVMLTCFILRGNALTFFYFYICVSVFAIILFNLIPVASTRHTSSNVQSLFFKPTKQKAT